MVKEQKETGFLDHLEELRGRIIKSLISIILISIVAYFFSERLIDFVSKPIPELYFMSPTEAFATRIKLSLIAGIIASVPVIFYHLWQFVVPGLFEREIKLVVPVVLSSTIFFLIGAVFCFLLVLPLSIKFLLGFGTEKLKPMIKIGDYVSFVSYLILAFGAVFELPVIAYFLGKLGIITPQTLKRGRRYAIVGMLVLSSVITPPDMFSQLMLTGPLYFLYEVSIVVVRIVQRKKSREE
ncbi:MAG: twin-arginine translocase subunit TatC [candidate division Zixibacteria bacterium]|nr:twin-arginine translocase subunit TatC [candidate division Zixibacteria bacterium]